MLFINTFAFPSRCLFLSIMESTFTKVARSTSSSLPCIVANLIMRSGDIGLSVFDRISAS